MELNLVTDENKERLILEVQKYPRLYDPRTGGYYDKTARGNAWEKVAFAIGIPGKGKKSFKYY